MLLAGVAFFLGGLSVRAQEGLTPAAPKASAAAPLAPVDRKPGAVGSKLAFPTEVATPLKVGVAITWNQVAKLNEGTGTFEGSIDLQLRWRDPRQAFDPKATGTDRQEFGNDAATAKLAGLWTPQVSIVNLLDKPSRSEPGLFIYSDGTVVYIQRLRAIFESPYQLKAFPFDRQTPTVRLISRYGMNEVAFVQDQKDIDQSGIREGMRISGWRVSRPAYVSTRTRGWNGDYFPQFEASITLVRDPFSHILVIFIPFILVLFVPTMMTLYAKVDVGPRLTAWAGSILALIALNFTLTVRYPALDSSSLVSLVVAIGLCFQLAMVLLTITFLHPPVAEKMIGKPLSEEVTSFLRWGVPITLVVFVVMQSFLTALAPV